MKNIPVFNNAVGADAFAGDGIYSAYFTQFNGKGRHGIKVTVGSTEATVLSPSRIIGKRNTLHPFDHFKSCTYSMLLLRC